MRLSTEAQRDHRRLVEHVIQATTEQFRPVRAAELDDSIVKSCTCGNRYVGQSCPRCGTQNPDSGNQNGADHP